MKVTDTLVHAYALACSALLMYFVLLTLDTLRRYKAYRISSRLCCQILNRFAPMKTIIHMHYPFILLLNGYDGLFMLHLPLMIWSWLSLPTVEYEVQDIQQGNVIQSYYKNLLIQLLLFGVAGSFHLMPLSGVMFVKILELEVLWEDTLRAATNRAEDMLLRGYRLQVD